MNQLIDTDACVNNLLVFIYGSLKRNHGGVISLERDGQKFIKQIHTTKAYKLYDLGTYPAMIEDLKNGNCIRGELWEISADYLRNVLDPYESASFKRKTISVKDNTLDGLIYAYIYENVAELSSFKECGTQWPQGHVLQDAIADATKWHTEQYRKDYINGVRIPYITHPLEVMKQVWLWGVGDEDILVAAILHDALEDTEITRSQIENTYGERVASLVSELTKPEHLSKDDYLNSFAFASIEALIIKLADRFCNVKDFNVKNPKYAVKYFKHATIVYDTFFARSKEVGQKYGHDTRESIIHSYDSLVSQLGVSNVFRS